MRPIPRPPQFPRHPSFSPLLDTIPEFMGAEAFTSVDEGYCGLCDAKSIRHTFLLESELRRVARDRVL